MKNIQFAKHLWKNTAITNAGDFMRNFALQLHIVVWLKHFHFRLISKNNGLFSLKIWNIYSLQRFLSLWIIWFPSTFPAFKSQFITIIIIYRRRMKHFYAFITSSVWHWIKEIYISAHTPENIAFFTRAEFFSRWILNHISFFLKVQQFIRYFYESKAL